MKSEWNENNYREGKIDLSFSTLLKQAYIKAITSNVVVARLAIGEALYLDLSNNNITDVQSIGELLKTNNTLTELYLRNNNITDVQSIGDALKTNNTLTTLFLQNNNITCLLYTSPSPRD